MSIPLICRIETTQKTAARPSVAVSAAAVRAAVLALAIAAEPVADVAPAGSMSDITIRPE
jgi:hypothetical protein